MLAGSGSGLATCLRKTIKPARAPPGLSASRSTGLPASMRALGARSIRRTPCMVPATIALNGPSQPSGIRASSSRNAPAKSCWTFEGPLSDGGFNRWIQRTRDCASRRSVADEGLRLGSMQGAERKEDQSECGKPVHASCVEMATRCRSAACHPNGRQIKPRRRPLDDERHRFGFAHQAQLGALGVIHRACGAQFMSP
jgi:hypothetical protein